MITVQCEINKSIEKVWKLWTSPDHIMQWNNASDDWYTPHAENDLRVGGKFKYTMASRDGTMSFDFEGVYTNVANHSLIEYKLADNRKVIVTFKSQENGVVVTEKFDPETENSEALQQQGWQAILDNFKKYAENISI
ncbi:SRPBCC family protein [Flavobacterium maritimum]|uniref:SRPBCC family protein n=1 Tax=Flavobacterium maritimum TaxID=3149042 RepID=UPI0032B325A1